MLLAGPSKAGKSFALIELCIAIAEGTPWLGRFSCAQGKVLYINLELDRASCLHRFKDVYTALGLPPQNLRNIDIWNLRGASVPMDKLAPKLIRRAGKKGYTAVILDPIYKVITGDENSADQMAKFCNQFDLVCRALDCAVIYCHHHSKGAQGGKRSMDRASGSGVFARDPDAMLDMTELTPTDAIREQLRNKAACRVIKAMLDKRGHADAYGPDDTLSKSRMLAVAKECLGLADLRAIDAEVAAAQKQAAQLKDLGFGGLPICMAKTQYSFSDDPSLLGAPRGFTVTVRNLKVSAGAGFLVALTGDIMTMPGLPKVPAAERIDVDENGRISGLF